jgi:hypothetical protein
MQIIPPVPGCGVQTWLVPHDTGGDDVPHATTLMAHVGGGKTFICWVAVQVPPVGVDDTDK